MIHSEWDMMDLAYHKVSHNQFLKIRLRWSTEPREYPPAFASRVIRLRKQFLRSLPELPAAAQQDLKC